MSPSCFRKTRLRAVALLAIVACLIAVSGLSPVAWAEGGGGDTPPNINDSAMSCIDTVYEVPEESTLSSANPDLQLISSWLSLFI